MLEVNRASYSRWMIAHGPDIVSRDGDDVVEMRKFDHNAFVTIPSRERGPVPSLPVPLQDRESVGVESVGLVSGRPPDGPDVIRRHRVNGVQVDGRARNRYRMPRAAVPMK